MFATIYVPNFYLQAALRYGSADITPTGSTTMVPASWPRPVALIDEQEKKPVILQLNAAAEAAGVRQGMTPSQGVARSLSLFILTRSALQEKALQEILLQQAFALTPFVEATAPGLCTVQFTDTRNLIQKISRALEQLTACQIKAQAGLGPAPDISFLAAHLARPILQIDDAQKFLAPLPVEILAIDLDND